MDNLEYIKAQDTCYLFFYPVVSPGCLYYASSMHLLIQV